MSLHSPCAGLPHSPLRQARPASQPRDPEWRCPQASDPIPPPAARQPAEALELASQALSDGDLETALAQYEPQARLVTWRRPPTSADGEVRNALGCFMALRLPLAVRIVTVLRAPGLALVICERHTAGTGPDGEEIKYRGNGCAVVRAQPDGTWRLPAVLRVRDARAVTVDRSG